MARPTKQAQHPDLKGAITTTAWQHIGQSGAAQLSLRAIARDLQISAQAIYHYYADRDALVTALIIEAYTSLGAHQRQARDAQPATDAVGRLRATGIAYRQWALANPQHYLLIFGTPIPDYHAPKDDIMPAAAGSLAVLISIVEQLRVQGQLRRTFCPTVTPPDSQVFAAWQGIVGPHDYVSLLVAEVIWARVHGYVSLELTRSLPVFAAASAALFAAELDAIRATFIQEPSALLLQ